MSEPREDRQAPSPQTSEDLWAQRRGKNIAIFAAIMALAVLFFVITILRMS
jgi:hypothetical protein